MDTTQAQHGGQQQSGTAFGPAPRAAHRCRSTRRSSRTAAGIALALGLVATGGVAHAAGASARRPRRRARPSRRPTGPGAPRTTAPRTTAPRATATQGYGDYGDQGYGGYGDLWNGSGTTQQQDATGSSDTTDASDAAEVGLVEITSTLTNGTAAGTGIVLSSDGTIVTNHHVVAGATAIKVTVVSTGQTYTAHYVGADPVKDVAVLKLVGAQGLQTASLDSSGVQSGDDVTAVGDANGDGGSLTAAAGTVTALDQSITVQDEDGTPHQLEGLIEVNADVIPGDSGGALRGSDGKVVGMNVAASSGTSDIRGYVIPLSTVLTAVQAISPATTAARSSSATRPTWASGSARTTRRRPWPASWTAPPPPGPACRPGTSSRPSTGRRSARRPSCAARWPSTSRATRCGSPGRRPTASSSPPPSRSAEGPIA